MLIEPTILELDDHDLALRRVGSGPPLLCLHGFPQTSACWFPLAERLGSRYELLMPDLPGMGRSDPAPRADGGTVAGLLVRMLDELGIDRVTVVGHDFGGAVAWALGIAHPDRVDRLVVVNSPLRRLDLRRGWHMLFFNLPILPELVFTATGGALVERLIHLVSKNRQAFDHAAMQEYRSSLRTIEAQRNAFSYYRTVTRGYMRSAIKRMLPFVRPGSRPTTKIEVPTLVVWGDADPVLPVSLTTSMHEHVSDLTIEVLEGVGHFVPEEAPDALAQRIEAFITSS